MTPTRESAAIAERTRAAHQSATAAVPVPALHRLVSRSHQHQLRGPRHDARTGILGSRLRPGFGYLLRRLRAARNSRLAAGGAVERPQMDRAHFDLRGASWRRSPGSSILPAQFYWARFMLGVAEAGFFPGVIVYLTHWYRDQDRARALGMFTSAIPIAQVIGAPISGAALTDSLARLLRLALAADPRRRTGGDRWDRQRALLPDRPAIGRTLAGCGRTRVDRRASWQREGTGARGASRVYGKRCGIANVLLLTAVYFLGACSQYGFSFCAPEDDPEAVGVRSFDPGGHDRRHSVPGVRGPRCWRSGWSSDRTGERRWHTAGAYVVLAVGLAGGVWAGENVALGVVMFSLAGIGVSADCLRSGRCRRRCSEGQRRPPPSAPSTVSVIWAASSAHICSAR